MGGIVNIFMYNLMAVAVAHHQMQY